MERNQKNITQKKTVFKTSNDDLPDNYDLREAYPNCPTIKKIRDQSTICGGADMIFAPVETMSDRLCIFSKGEKQKPLSVTYVLSCCYYCLIGCEGLYPTFVFDFWVETGIPTGGEYGDNTTCLPYFEPPGEYKDIPHVKQNVKKDIQYLLKKINLMEEISILSMVKMIL